MNHPNDGAKTTVSLSLPTFTDHVWRRLRDLTNLDWPTLAEQIERKALVAWLEPGSAPITDIDVLELASNGTSRFVDDDLKLRAIFEQVWGKLSKLAAGEQLELARPTAWEDDETSGYTRRSRQAQAKDWFLSVMETLSDLLRRELVYPFDLTGLILPELRDDLRADIVRQLIPDCYGIGVSMARETWYGEGEVVLHVSTTLAQAMKLLLEELSRDDGSQAARLIASLDFFVQELKGYLWAYSQIAGDNNQLAKFYAKRPSDWKLVKSTLLSSVTVLHTRRNEGAIAWPERSCSCGREAALLPASELIPRVEARIGEAARWLEALKNSR